MSVNYTHNFSWRDVKKKIPVAECYKIVIENLPVQISNFETKIQENFIAYAQSEIYNIAQHTESIEQHFKQEIAPKIVLKSFDVFLVKQKHQEKNTLISNLISEAKLRLFDDYKTQIYPFIECNDTLDDNEKNLLKNYVFQCGLDKIQKKRESVLKLLGLEIRVNSAIYYSFLEKKSFLNCVKKALETAHLNLKEPSQCFDEFQKCFNPKGSLSKIVFRYSDANIAEVEERLADHLSNLQLDLIEKIKGNKFCLSSQLSTYVEGVISNKFKEDYRQSKINLPINYELIDDYLDHENHEGNMILYYLIDTEYTQTLDPKKVDIFKMDLEGIKDEKIAEKYNETVDNIRQIRSRTRKNALQFLIKNAQKVSKWIKQQDINGQSQERTN